MFILMVSFSRNGNNIEEISSKNETLQLMVLMPGDTAPRVDRVYADLAVISIKFEFENAAQHLPSASGGAIDELEAFW